MKDDYEDYVDYDYEDYEALLDSETHRHKRYMSAVVYEAGSHQPVRAD